MKDYSKIFNLTKEDVVKEKVESVDLRFNPSPIDGKDYIAKVRFVPYIHEDGKNNVESIKYFAYNESTGDKFYGYCPSTVGQGSIMKDAWIACKESKSAIENDYTDALKNGKRYTSAILVIEDKQHPENEGKILFWDYGRKIAEKIELQLENDFGTETNVFDPMEGKMMVVKVTKKGENNNYDGCQFSPNSEPISFNGMTLEATQESQGKFIEFLLEMTPKNINDYIYKDWTDNVWEQAFTYLNTLLTSTKMKETLWKKHGNNYQDWLSGAGDEFNDVEKTIINETTSENGSNIDEDSLLNSL